MEVLNLPKADGFRTRPKGYSQESFSLTATIAAKAELPHGGGKAMMEKNLLFRPKGWIHPGIVRLRDNSPTVLCLSLAQERRIMKPVALAALIIGLIAASCAPVSEVPQPRVELSSGAQLAFEKYRSDPKYYDFKAFAVDPNTGSWGWAWGYLQHPKQAIDRALNYCRKRGQACQLYAVGNTIVLGMSPEEVASETKEYRDQGMFAAFEEYRSSPNYSDFKAFAVDLPNASWGHSWGQAKPKLAIDRALQDCRSIFYRYTASEKCELYAVGITVVSGMSSEQIASVTKEYVAAVVKDKKAKKDKKSKK